MTKPFLPQRGGYRSLKVYRVTTLIYDLTYHFAHTYLKAYDRTIDQMVQAARSGKQNIAEGSMAGTHSSETEIRLTSVAKASLEELLVDYEDYLRTRGLPGWGPGHPRYDRLRAYARSEGIYSDCPKIFGDLCIIPHLRRHFRDSGLVMCVSTLPSPSLSVPCIWGILQSPCRKSGAFSAKDHFAKVFFGQMSDEELANLAITLIHQATYMLRRLVERQQEMFLEGGGIREQMSRARRGYRSPDKR